jgi:hypothetical protein
LLEQLFYLRAFLLSAISLGEFRDPFPDFGWDGGCGPTGDFLAAAIEELQQNFEIVIHGQKVANGKPGLRQSCS